MCHPQAGQSGYAKPPTHVQDSLTTLQTHTAKDQTFSEILASPGNLPRLV